MTNGSLMKVKNIAECPPPIPGTILQYFDKGGILQYFWPALSDN